MSILAGTALFLSSCTKEKPLVPLADQLADQTQYKVLKVSFNEIDITNYATGMYNADMNTAKAYMELHLDDANQGGAKKSTSKIFVNTNANADVSLMATKTNSSSAITLILKEQFPVFIGIQGGSNTPNIPNELIQNGLVQTKCDGNCWYQFTRNGLSGTYQIQATSDGFRLTCKSSGDTIIWDLGKI